MSKIIFYDNDIFLNQTYGGIRTYFENLIKNLSIENNELQVHPSSLKYLKLKPKYYLGKKYISFDFFYLLMSFLKPLIDSKIYKNKIIYHSTYYRNFFLGFINLPKVITVHDMVHELHPEYFSKKYRSRINIYINMKKKAIFNSNHIICPSNATRNDLCNFYPSLNEEKVSVVHHGVNHLSELSNEEFQFNKYKNLNYLIYVGSRGHYKGFKYLFEAFLTLRKIIKGLKLICVGSKPTAFEKDIYKYNHFQQEIIYIQVNNNVLKDLYKGALAAIYPSYYEGFGFPILEAMSNSCPMICTSIASSKEVGGKIPFYIDKYSSSQIVDRVIQIYKNEYDSNKIKDGILHAKKFTWSKCAYATNNVYKKLNNV